MKAVLDHVGIAVKDLAIEWKSREILATSARPLLLTAVDEMAKRGELRLWPRPPVAEYQKIIDILGEEIHAMLRRDKTIKAALNLAQNRIDRMMRDAKRY